MIYLLQSEMNETELTETWTPHADFTLCADNHYSFWIHKKKHTMIIITSMNGCGWRVGAQLSFWPIPSIYSGWKSECYSFIYSGIWERGWGGAQPSPDQAKAGILYREGSPWSRISGRLFHQEDSLLWPLTSI